LEIRKLRKILLSLRLKEEKRRSMAIEEQRRLEAEKEKREKALKELDP
jgi:hypothetical protein